MAGSSEKFMPINRHEPSRLTPLSLSLYVSLMFVSGALYLLPVIFPSHIGTGYIVLYALMTLCSLWIWQRGESDPKHILLLSIILCLILLPMGALTSNDAERYLWDGAVLVSGFDPYITAPDDTAVAELRSLWPTPEEHTAYPTLYPPGALLLFSLSALAGPIYGFWIWKALAILAAILTLITAYDLLKQRNALQHYALIGLSPLLLFETGAAAHVDIFCVLGITAALWCVEKDKIIYAGFIIGIAASIKFLPAVIAGPLLFYLIPRKAIGLFLSSSLTWGLFYLAMFGLGYKPLGILPTFFEKWRGGAPVYPILTSVKEIFDMSEMAFMGLLGSLAILGFSISALLAHKEHIFIAIMLALATPLILTPILFPWYLIVLVPLLALRPNATLIITVALSPLTYVVLNDWVSQGIWQPEQWPNNFLLVGVLLGLAIDAMHRFDNSKQK